MRDAQEKMQYNLSTGKIREKYKHGLRAPLWLPQCKYAASAETWYYVEGGLSKLSSDEQPWLMRQFGRTKGQMEDKKPAADFLYEMILDNLSVWS